MNTLKEATYIEVSTTSAELRLLMTKFNFAKSKFNKSSEIKSTEEANVPEMLRI